MSEKEPTEREIQVLQAIEDAVMSYGVGGDVRELLGEAEGMKRLLFGLAPRHFQFLLAAVLFTAKGRRQGTMQKHLASEIVTKMGWESEIAEQTKRIEKYGGQERGR